MNHPYELLADLVDGTLDADDRARVEAHLEECPSCRDDVASATIGRREARSLPQEAAPAGLHRRVVAQAGGPGDADTHQGAARWVRWAGVAAAAAIVAAIAIALPDVGGQGAGQRASGDAGAEVAAPGGSAEAGAGAEVPLEVSDRDYDAEGLERLAREASGDRAAMASSDGVQLNNAPSAFRCVRRAFEEQPAGRLTRLILARFEGRAAYIAVYLEGPGANQPPDSGTVWVAARDDCSILSFAQARL
jgi:anti-sigma factor RsiW